MRSLLAIVLSLVALNSAQAQTPSFSGAVLILDVNGAHMIFNVTSVEPGADGTVDFAGDLYAGGEGRIMFGMRFASPDAEPEITYILFPASDPASSSWRTPDEPGAQWVDGSFTRSKYELTGKYEASLCALAPDAQQPDPGNCRAVAGNMTLILE